MRYNEKVKETKSSPHHPQMNSELLQHFIAWRDSIPPKEFLEMVQSNPHLDRMVKTFDTMWAINYLFND